MFAERALADTHAVVTGGTRGIGLAIARRLCECGARVSVVSRSAGDSAIEPNVRRAFADVADEAAVTAAFAACRDANGPIAVLVNAAGIAESAPLARTTPAMWSRVLGTNVTGTFLCTREAAGDMLAAGWGRVLNVASIAGLYGAPYISAYCASKHAVVGFTRAIAAEFEGRGVTANALCPGYTETDMVRAAIANIVKLTGVSEPEARLRLAGSNPQGRIATVAEVADAAIALLESQRNGETAIVPAPGA